MKKNILSAAIATMIASGQAYAGDADVFVFVENSPLQGVDVSINGSTIGQTNPLGEASSTIDASGKQTISIERDGEQLAITKFDYDATQNVEVSVVLSTQEEPTINVFKTGDDETRAIGSLRGVIKSTDDLPLANALVTIEGSSTEVVTGTDGEFSFNLPRGEYNLRISHPEYSAKELNNVRIIANIGTAAIIKLAKKLNAGPQLDIAAPVEEVVVLGRFSANEDSTFQVEQMSTAVVDAIDMEAIIRFGDSNVASVLKRVVGIAIVDGKYAVVRGLSGRYISAELNKALMPTTDPFRRDAELDIYPSDILSGIEIQKSFSADLPADSTAGSIFVKTQGIPDDYKNKFGISLGYNTSVTGEDFLRTDDGSGNFYGYDADYRALPSAVDQATNGGRDFSVCQVQGQQNCVTTEEAAHAATRLRNVWEPKTESAPNDFGLSYTLGNIYDTSFGSVGVLGSISFDKEYKSKVDASLNNPVGTEGDYIEDTVDTSLNAYLVAGIELDNGSELLSRTMILRNTDDKTRHLIGFDNGEESEFETVTIQWKERELFAQQFSGHHFVTEEQELDWRVSIFDTQSDIPDRRTYTYFGDFLSFSTVERLWNELNEEGLDVGIDYTLPLEFSSEWRADIKIGGLYNTKDRENEIIRLGINRPRIPLNDNIETLLQPQTFFDDNMRLRGTTTDTDTYEAEQETNAVYVSTETHYNELLTLIFGLRHETFEQDLVFPNRTTGVNEIHAEDDGVYPSLGLIYRPTQDWQFRFGYSETISRPTLTEIAPTSYYDDDSDEYVGNEFLVTSDITNLDIRADYYFGDEGNISLAFFHKDIENPVEVGVADGSGSATSALTWRNEDSATIQGIEFDISTEFWNSGSHSAFIGGNLTLIDSEVTLTDDSVRLQVDEKRDLQGQSSTLANLQLGYDHLDSGQKLTLLINHFDDRIDEVTRSPEEVIYEKGRMSIDINYELPLFDERATFKAKIKNLTNEAVEFEQAGRVVERWKVGTKISLSFSYNF